MQDPHDIANSQTNKLVPCPRYLVQFNNITSRDPKHRVITQESEKPAAKWKQPFVMHMEDSFYWDYWDKSKMPHRGDTLCSCSVGLQPPTDWQIHESCNAWGYCCNYCAAKTMTPTFLRCCIFLFSPHTCGGMHTCLDNILLFPDSISPQWVLM